METPRCSPSMRVVDREDVVGVGLLAGRPAERVEEAQPGFVFAHGAFRAAALHRGARPLGDLADQRELVRRPVRGAAWLR